MGSHEDLYRLECLLFSQDLRYANERVLFLTNKFSKEEAEIVRKIFERICSGDNLGVLVHICDIGLCFNSLEKHPPLHEDESEFPTFRELLDQLYVEAEHFSTATYGLSLHSRQLILLLLAVALLNLYLQLNWTGPELDSKATPTTEFITDYARRQKYEDDLKTHTLLSDPNLTVEELSQSHLEFQRGIVEYMEVDGEVLYHLAKGIPYLFTSYLIMEALYDYEITMGRNYVPTLFIWRARLAFVWQRSFRKASEVISPTLSKVYLDEFSANLRNWGLLTKDFEIKSREISLADVKSTLKNLQLKLENEGSLKFSASSATLSSDSSASLSFPASTTPSATSSTVNATSTNVLSSGRAADLKSSLVFKKPGVYTHAAEYILTPKRLQELMQWMPAPCETESSDSWRKDASREKIPGRHTMPSMLILELALRYGFFGNIELLKGSLDLACKLYEFEFETTGTMGIRRKNQAVELAQLAVMAGRTRPDSNAEKTINPLETTPKESQTHSESEKTDEGLNKRNYQLEDDEVEGKRFLDDFPSFYEDLKVEEDAKRVQKKVLDDSSSLFEDTTQNPSFPSPGGAAEAASSLLSEVNEASSSDADASKPTGSSNLNHRIWSLSEVDPDTDLLEFPRRADEEAKRASPDWNSSRFLNDPFKTQLDSYEQILLLSHCWYISLSNPALDQMASEELNAAIQRIMLGSEGKSSGSSSLDAKYENILGFPSRQVYDEENRNGKAASQRRNWLVDSAALWFRSKTEMSRSLYIQRGSLQLQSLVGQYSDESPKASHRLLYFHQLLYSSRWEAQKELGTQMLRMGSLISAYNMFKELKMWEDASECLIAAGRFVDAKNLLAERLAILPTPHLWCSLGDIEKNVEHYETAWKLSNFKYARAQRSLGFIAFKEGAHLKASKAFELALNINRMHTRSWYLLGICYMLLERWRDSLNAFVQLVMLDIEASEGWANMATVHMQLSCWKEASICIEEGLRRKRDNSKMWEMHIRVNVKLRDISKVINALEALLQLNMKNDIEDWILLFLCDMVELNLETSVAGRTGNFYFKDVLKIFSALSQALSQRPNIWYLYADLLMKKKDFPAAFEAYAACSRALQAQIFRDGVIADEVIAQSRSEKQLSDAGAKQEKHGPGRRLPISENARLSEFVDLLSVVSSSMCDLLVKNPENWNFKGVSLEEEVDKPLGNHEIEGADRIKELFIATKSVRSRLEEAFVDNYELVSHQVEQFGTYLDCLRTYAHSQSIEGNFEIS